MRGTETSETGGTPDLRLWGEGHLKGCASYQESSKKSEEQWAKYRAMIESADEETFSKLQKTCYSKAIDDNYEAYMSAPEGSPERSSWRSS
jgi:hypothetical protein